MVRVTWLSPTKSYSYYSSALSHLEKLDLQALNDDPSTRSNHWATIQNKQQVQLRATDQNKRKALKESTRNTENKARVEKKRLSEDSKENKRSISFIFSQKKEYKLHLF